MLILHHFQFVVKAIHRIHDRARDRKIGHMFRIYAQRKVGYASQ
jgi:hypothetical protein